MDTADWVMIGAAAVAGYLIYRRYASAPAPVASATPVSAAVAAITTPATTPAPSSEPICIPAANVTGENCWATAAMRALPDCSYVGVDHSFQANSSAAWAAMEISVPPGNSPCPAGLSGILAGLGELVRMYGRAA